MWMSIESFSCHADARVGYAASAPSRAHDSPSSPGATGRHHTLRKNSTWRRSAGKSTDRYFSARWIPATTAGGSDYLLARDEGAEWSTHECDHRSLLVTAVSILVA